MKYDILKKRLLADIRPMLIYNVLVINGYHIVPCGCTIVDRHHIVP